ncbi:TetR/AcrR family transcriptional regulator [Nigerium massiliense]|uniref:TetR/AcrR family transcriptional regulator n=1 Tax=Nigerium massiliense TaxID=1522317 RepID=UPI00058C90C6|nr:TetR/AcrR family transcriptional regulator [Nigerium massiliense]
MDDTRDAVLNAARRLFFKRRYDDVTVQHIADEAQVAVGTVFYHGLSKAGLFLGVHNGLLEQAIDEGEQASRRLGSSASPSELIEALVRPVAQLHVGPRAASMARYQRDLLFGDCTDAFRREGFDLVRRLESLIASILAPDDPEDSSARLAARTIFAALQFDTALPASDLGASEPFARSGAESLRRKIDMVVEGFLSLTAGASAARAESPGVSVPTRR